jgi:methylated-DNA-protein-cysteine methyltransferase-like protein
MEIPEAERTAFYEKVWMIARLIPRGKVYTYGQIAALIPVPAGVLAEQYPALRSRWVGYAMAECPQDVPWQRVINAQGGISPRKGADLQRKLLEEEGITFDLRQRVDLARYGWLGPDDEWLQANQLQIPPKIAMQPSLFS